MNKQSSKPRTSKNQVIQLIQEAIPPDKCIGASFLTKSGAIKEHKTKKEIIEGAQSTQTKEFRQQITKLPSDKLEGVQGQLQVQFENNNKTYVGTGTICIFGQGFEKEKYFVLTCAHNVKNIIIGGRNTTQDASKITFFYSRENENTYYCQLIGQNALIYDDYEDNNEIFHGYDLALIKLNDDIKMGDVKAPLSTNSCWSYLDGTDAKPGSIIKVIGYPGEYDGKLYFMEGTIKEIIQKENGHAIITYDDIDTSEGQSGSPVYYKGSDDVWFIIGVHVGVDPSKEFNIATAITRVVYDWILEQQEKL